MMKPKATIRSGFETVTVEARNKGSLRKRKPPSTRPCWMSRADQFLLSKLARFKDVGSDNETGPTMFFLGDAFLLKRKRRLALPALSGNGLLRRPALPLKIFATQPLRTTALLEELSYHCAF
jgi:hypothetical protein